MKRKRFTPAVCFVLLGLVAHLLGGAASGAFAADGVKVGQTIEVQYQVGAKTVYASATLSADGTLSFAFPSEDGLRVGWATYKLVRSDVQPGPDPKPDPKPDPPPPDEKAAFVYLIHESRPPTPDLKFAAIDNDKGWRDVADGLKVGWRVLDQDNQALKKMPAPLITARATGLPACVFVFPSGASKGEPLKGKTPADMAELVKKYGGGVK